MSYEINFETYKNYFVLPQDILNDIDTLDSDFLKVILVIFRNNDKHYSPNLISNLLNIQEQRVNEALEYWIGRGILIFTENIKEISKPVILSKQPAVFSIKSSSQELKYLLECMEATLARPITSAEHKSVVHILEFIKLPADVVLMAIQYCVSINKLSPRYLEKICATWADNGINSHELAEKYLNMLSTLKSKEHQVQKLFGIENRNLIETEQEFIRKWIIDYSFDLDVIQLAYEKTITAIGKLAFPYLNKILQSWHENGYKTVTDVISDGGVNKSNHTANKKTSYDIDELDRFWNNVPKLNS